MARHKQEVAIEDGWTRWISPNHKKYKMTCCDCGLVHELQFSVVEGESGFEAEDLDAVVSARVVFRVKRDNRATGQVRRHMQALQGDS